MAILIVFLLAAVLLGYWFYPWFSKGGYDVTSFIEKMEKEDWEE